MYRASSNLVADESISRIFRDVLSFLQVPQNQQRLSVNYVNSVTFFPKLGTIWARFFPGRTKQIYSFGVAVAGEVLT